jgi:hypothetical protein
MRNFRQGCLRQQLQFMRRQYLQGGELPSSKMLSESLVARPQATDLTHTDFSFLPSLARQDHLLPSNATQDRF